MTSQCLAVSKLRIMSILFIISSEAKVIFLFLYFNHPNQFLLDYLRKGGNCMTTGGTSDNKARHLSMAALTNMW